MHASAGTRRRRLVALGLSTMAVTGFGILPAATAATVVTAPSAGDITLVSGADAIRSDWHVENAGGAGDGTADGPECDGHPGMSVSDAEYLERDSSHADAFDTGLAFFVGGGQLVAPESWDLDIDDEGLTRAVTAGPILATDGLEATVGYRAMTSKQVLRSAVRLSNETSEPVSTTFTVATNVGSDDTTLVLGSSSGDTSVTDDDRWLVTGDSASFPSDPVVTHVLAGPGEVVSPPHDLATHVFDCAGTEGVAATFDVDVEPGASRTLVFFDELSVDPALAIETAARFGDASAADSELFAGLSPDDLASVANWTFAEQEPEPEPTPAPSPAPVPRDSVAPTSTATSPAVSASSAWPVSFSASDVGDGVGSVELFVKRPGAADYTSAGRISGQPAGAFDFDSAGVEGSYSFYTVATDLAGNAEPAPATADTTTVVDTLAATVKAKMGKARPIPVDLGEPGPVALRMWVSEAADTTFVIRQDGETVRRLATNRTPAGLVVQHWNGRDADGDKVEDGRYKLVMRATDLAGHVTAVRTPMRLVR